MSLFTARYQPGPRADEQKALAVLAPAVCVMLADDRITDDELRQIATLCTFSPLYRGFNADQLHQMIAELVREIDRFGVDATLAGAAKALSPGLRETAFVFAARIATAGHDTEAAEEAALMQTVRHMKIGRATFREVLDVARILDRGPND